MASVPMTTPVRRKQCALCCQITEISHVDLDGKVTTVKFDLHTEETCRSSTLQRIKVLEELHIRDRRDIDHQTGVIQDLGLLIGSLSSVVSAGRRWIEHRRKRAEDLVRLRNTFGTQDRAIQHPLWQAEEDVAAAIDQAIGAVEKRNRA